MLSLPDFKEKNVIICFSNEDQRVSFKNDNLLIRNAEEEIVLQTTCHKLLSVWVVGPTYVTSGILERSRKFGFSIYLFSYNYRPYGVWSSPTEGNYLLRKKQYAYNSLDIARQIVRNKISNQAGLLNQMRDKSPGQKTAIKKLREYSIQTDTAIDLQTLLGLEGVASRMYFSQYFGKMQWKGRKPRAKTDCLNTTLDIGYTYLFNFMECLLNLYGFDIYQGVYHRCFYQRKSLVCDFVEPFRCLIDRQIRKAAGLGQFKPEHFEEHKGQYFLKREKNKDYARWLMESILENKEKMFSFVQEYYRCFMRNRPIEAYPDFKINE